MATPVIMPKFEMAQEEGTVVLWLKQEGESVNQGDPLLEVQTDKVIMEVEAPVSGVLVAIHAQAGEVVPIGQPIAHILQPGENWPIERGFLASGEGSPPPTPGATSRLTPLAGRVARDQAVDLDGLTGTGPGGRVTKADVLARVAERRAGGPVGGQVRAVPAARRLAREQGVDLASVAGSGPGGRIQSEDVRLMAQSAAPIPQGQLSIRKRTPLSGMRRTIAERMTASVREIPQFSVSAEAEMGRALAVVADWQETDPGGDRPRVTLTALMVKACAWALARHPAVNASLELETILEWAEINIGVATAVEGGLVVPVVHAADQLTLEGVARRLADCTARAREGALRPGDVLGGTFTLSNLGMYRVDHFTALINPPQAAILAVGRVRPQAHQDAQGGVTFTPAAAFTLTADHRLLDGVMASRFLADVLKAIEHPGLLVEGMSHQDIGGNQRRSQN